MANESCTVSLQNGCVYVSIADGKVDHTEEILPGIVFGDYAKGGELLGLEILTASKPPVTSAKSRKQRTRGNGRSQRQ